MMKLYLCEFGVDNDNLICESNDFLEIEEAVYEHNDEVINNADLFFDITWEKNGKTYGHKEFFSYRDFVSFSDCLKILLDKHNIL